MDLYLLRHGEAGRPLPIAQKDRERTLTSRGKDDVEIVSDAVKNLGLKFDHIASSPLPRSKETAAIIAKRQKRVPVDLWDELKPEGDKRAFMSKLARLNHDSKVLVVGHEPYLTSLVAMMTGTSDGAILLKKAGLMRVRVTNFSPSAKGELRWLLSPKILSRLS